MSKKSERGHQKEQYRSSILAVPVDFPSYSDESQKTCRLQESYQGGRLQRTRHFVDLKLARTSSLVQLLEFLIEDKEN